MATVATASSLIERYDAFLLDAYGVLVDGTGPLPHAAEFVRTLAERSKRRLLLSNDASRTPGQVITRLRGFDILLEDDEVLTSGMMLQPWVAQHGLEGAPAVVLGPEGSRRLATEASLRCVPPDDRSARVVVVCDEAGYDFLPTLEALLTTLIARQGAGEPTALVLPNPDVLYPKLAGAVGLTAGAAACVIERALLARFPDAAPRFDRLGKPHAPIFEAALARVPGRVLMIGDQLETDVAGARAAGIDVALAETGVGRRPPPQATLQPTWILESLEMR